MGGGGGGLKRKLREFGKIWPIHDSCSLSSQTNNDFDEIEIFVFTHKVGDV